VPYHREQQEISISQSNYIETMLTRLTPLDPNIVLQKRSPDEAVDLKIRSGYQSMIGSLMYAAIATRPDIAYAV
jgi:hypothetical protein